MSWQLFWQIIGLTTWTAFLVALAGASFKSPGGKA